MQNTVHQNEEFDVFSLIRSQELRDYYRKNWHPDVCGKEQIIIRSFRSLEEKKELLKQYANSLEGKENELPYEMAALYDRVLSMIHNPPRGTTFVTSILTPAKYFEGGVTPDNAFDKEIDSVELMDSYVELEEYASDWDCPFQFDVVMLVNYKKHEEKLQFTMERLGNGRIGVWDFRIPNIHSREWEPWDKKPGGIDICGSAIDRQSSGFGRHPFPYESGARLKLQTPMMRYPFYGVLQSELDGLGCWYHFLYPAGSDPSKSTWDDFIDFIDISYAEVSIAERYSVFDWIERV